MVTNHRQLVVICSNTSFDANPLGAKPLALSLSRNCDVIYIDPPLSYVTAIKQPRLRKSLREKRLQQLSPTLKRLIPVVLPGKDRAIIHHVTSFLLRRKIRHAIKSFGHAIDNNVMIIATAPHYRVFLKETFNVYWMMDDYASQPELTGISQAILHSGQQKLATTSNVNVVVSDFLRSALKNQGHESAVITNGADSSLFTFPTSEIPSEILDKLPDHFALYVGGINKRIDLSYLSTVSETDNLVIAGNIDPRMDANDFTQLCSKKNVTYLGSVDNAYIPGIMNKATVGLVPYALTTFNQSSMPLKIPEYLLCGLIVVSSDLEFVHSFRREDVYGESDPQSFSHRVHELMLKNTTPGQRAMRSSRISDEWSWDQKAQEFLELFPVR